MFRRPTVAQLWKVCRVLMPKAVMSAVAARGETPSAIKPCRAVQPGQFSGHSRVISMDSSGLSPERIFPQPVSIMPTSRGDFCKMTVGRVGCFRRADRVDGALRAAEHRGVYAGCKSNAERIVGRHRDHAGLGTDEQVEILGITDGDVVLAEFPHFGEWSSASAIDVACDVWILL